MNSRFLTNTALAVLGGFTALTALVFTATTFHWLMLGAGIAAIAAGGGIAARRRGATQRSLDAAIAGLGAWTIVASLVFAAGVVTWLGFASGAGLVVLALAGLTLHELSTERVVHSFEVRTPAAEPDLARANG